MDFWFCFIYNISQSIINSQEFNATFFNKNYTNENYTNEKQLQLEYSFTVFVSKKLNLRRILKV